MLNQTGLVENTLRDRHVMTFDLFNYEETAIMGNKEGYTFTNEKLMTNWYDFK